MNYLIDTYKNIAQKAKCFIGNLFVSNNNSKMQRQKLQPLYIYNRK